MDKSSQQGVFKKFNSSLYHNLSLAIVSIICVYDFFVFQVTTKAALLRSMIHNNTEYTSLNLSVTNSPSSESTITPNDSGRKINVSSKSIDDVKLWQRPTSSSSSQHKRYYSMPVDDSTNQSLKVLWV